MLMRALEVRVDELNLGPSPSHNEQALTHTHVHQNGSIPRSNGRVSPETKAFEFLGVSGLCGFQAP